MLIDWWSSAYVRAADSPAVLARTRIGNEKRVRAGNALVGIVPDSPDCLRAGPKRLATRGLLRIALEPSSDMRET
jgi:hypothetical protein